RSTSTNSSTCSTTTGRCRRRVPFPPTSRATIPDTRRRPRSMIPPPRGRWSRPTSAERQTDELWKKNMDAIVIRMVFKKDQTPELRKMARAGKLQMRQDGWNADYPDAENFMQNLYGPNVSQSNDSRFKLPEFDRLYEQAHKLPDSPERTRRGSSRIICSRITWCSRGWSATRHIRFAPTSGSISTSTAASNVSLSRP